jgi:hypothetical protein
MSESMDLATSVAPVACTLSGEALRERGAWLTAAGLGAAQEIRELPDGYALRYNADADLARRLLAVIMAERECCPFFTFELAFAPDRGPLWLRLRGPEGTKAVIEGMLQG